MLRAQGMLNRPERRGALDQRQQRVVRRVAALRLARREAHQRFEACEGEIDHEAPSAGHLLPGSKRSCMRS
jgi:hypothetical protein